ncbi:polysaccharide export protein [Methylobacterium sp. 4-46]|uniref:polysaccharide biosynthesis/export family protein n=1 Tax=unclassified Methylobacterium TaxID=2615210 RepID=UPI000152D907|nr:MULTISPECIES: polysaccharide biosynthesis/export family protein [Methylobacterium]ACA18384.1 polysaccharide export protein [Methylobacterium sp. 4-46]WFT77675.1 polysaccharide biosynthesis/export family protein [Methylobacterium nodulans]
MKRLLAGLALAAVLSLPASADSFRLGPEDRVDVRVFGRPDMSLALKVDGDGNLRLPLVGSVGASGQTIDEVEARLIAACRERAGILEPRVTVTVLETAPIFVGGAVQNPGRYAWATDLTAAKAYVLAGGAPRLLENGGPLLVFEAYRAVEQEEQTQSRLAAAILRRARLSAEAASAPSFDVPEGWAEGLKPAQAEVLLTREMHLFAKRREAMTGEIKNLKRQSQILVEQEAALKASLAKKGLQLTMLQQELAAIGGDSETARLVPVTRLLALKRSIIDIENDQREIERRISETKLQGAIAEQTSANLENSRTIEASGQLAEVERELVSLRESLLPIRRRAEVGRTAVSASEARGGRARVPVFTIRRETGGTVQVLQADADTRLMPRDLVQIAAEPVPSADAERVAETRAGNAQAAPPRAPAAPAPKSPSPAGVGAPIKGDIAAALRPAGSR